MRSAIILAASIIYDVSGKECVITSICDGVHSARSFHYLLGAVDLRSKHLSSDEKDEVWGRLKSELGGQWDVLLEHRGGTNEHFHLEWDAGREQLMAYLGDMQEKFVEGINEELT